MAVRVKAKIKTWHGLRTEKEWAALAAAELAAMPRYVLQDRLLSERVTAQYLGLSYPHLRLMRRERLGPTYIRLGERRIAYRLSDIRAWCEARKRTSRLTPKAEQKIAA